MEYGRSEGLVIRVTGKEVWVQVGGETVSCLFRGRFRRDREGFHVVAGDRVEVSFPMTRGGNGVLEAVLPRRSWLSRYAGGRAATERMIVANVSLLFVVESLRSPDVNYRFVDRVLVSAENGRVDVRICVNKIDLLSDREELARFAAVYEPLGYPVTQTSAKTGEGMSGIAAHLGGGIYAFVGRSGVGKTSLLNGIAPGLDLKVRSVADKTGRGRHTTAYSQLFPIEGGYLADTPGMQTFGFPGTDKADLARCFPEFRDRNDDCRFRPCTHSHEPDCAVKEAVAQGKVAPTRYESYLDMLGEIEVREKSRYS